MFPQAGQRPLLAGRLFPRAGCQGHVAGAPPTPGTLFPRPAPRHVPRAECGKSRPLAWAGREKTRAPSMRVSTASTVLCIHTYLASFPASSAAQPAIRRPRPPPPPPSPVSLHRPRLPLALAVGPNSTPCRRASSALVRSNGRPQPPNVRCCRTPCLALVARCRRLRRAPRRGRRLTGGQHQPRHHPGHDAGVEARPL